MGQIEKQLKGKVVFKHETEAVWHTSNNGGPVEYVPAAGEKVLYDRDAKHDYTRIKYGDGTHIVAELPFSTEQPDWSQTDTKAIDHIKNKPPVTLDENGKLNIGDHNAQGVYIFSDHPTIELHRDGGEESLKLGSDGDSHWASENNIAIRSSGGEYPIDDYYLGLTIDGKKDVLRLETVSAGGSGDKSVELSIEELASMKNEIGAKANAFGNANATTYTTKYGPAYGGINTTSTGQASTAIGAGVTACSDGAFAAGVLTIAGNPESYTDAKYSGQGAAAFGISNPSQGKFGARGMASFVAGYNTYAKANATAAFGDSTKALGEASFAAGYFTIAEGNQSFATGRQTQALGNSSAAFGKETVAHAQASGALVAGLRCQAYVDGAIVLGDNLVGTQNTSNIGQVILGRYNKIETNSTDVLVVGCGTSANDRKNGFAIDANGNSTFGGTITVDGETFTAADIRKMKAFLATIAD